MNISTEHTIWCEFCPKWHQEAIRLKVDFVKMMRKGGWKQKDGKTACPECVKNLQCIL